MSLPARVAASIARCSAASKCGGSSGHAGNQPSSARYPTDRSATIAGGLPFLNSMLPATAESSILPPSCSNRTSLLSATTCAYTLARCSTAPGNRSTVSGSSPGAAPSSHRSVVRNTGASNAALPSKRGCEPSSRVMRPVRCNRAFPGSTASASRRINAPSARSNVACTRCTVPPPSSAEAVEKSMPIGRSMPPTVVPASNNAGSHAAKSSRPADNAISSRWLGATRRATAPVAGAPPSSNARSSIATRPLPIVSRPSARNGTGGVGSSRARLPPRLLIVPANVPSGPICPEMFAPSPLALP